MSGNALEALPAGVAALPALKRLAAGGNALRDLPAEWGACGALEELHLQGNLLTSVPDSLGDLPVRFSFCFFALIFGVLPWCCSPNATEATPLRHLPPFLRTASVKT